MTQQTKGAPALIFKETKFRITHRSGQQWLRSPQIGDALGYAKAGRISIDKLYKKHAAEFTDSMTAVVKLKTKGGEQEVRIFSLRGAHLLGMFARTEKAAEFRRWVLDILDNEIEAQAERRAKPGALKIAPQPVPQARAALPAVTNELQTRINKRAWELSHAAYDDYRKRMMDDVLVKGGHTKPEAWPEEWTPLENSQDVLEHICVVAEILKAHANSIHIRGRRLAEMVGKDYVKATAKYRPSKDEK